MPASLALIFGSSFVIALSGALMPGPLLTATIAESSRRGFIAGPLLIGGHAILEMALIGALLFSCRLSTQNCSTKGYTKSRPPPRLFSQ